MFSQDNADAGTYTVEIIATLPNLQSVSYSFTVTVHDECESYVPELLSPDPTITIDYDLKSGVAAAYTL